MRLGVRRSVFLGDSSIFGPLEVVFLHVLGIVKEKRP